MKILLVAQNYHPFVGGVEIHARQVAHELSKSHQVEVVASNFAPYRGPKRLAVLQTSLLVPAHESHADGKVPVHALTPTPVDRLRMLPVAARVVPKVQRYAYHGLNRYGYRSYRSVYLPRLRRLVRGADVVHSLAGGYLGWAAQEAAREAGIPFVCTPFAHPGQWGDGPDDLTYYRGAQAVIGLVETDKEYLRSLGVPADKLHVVGVSPDLPASADSAGFRRKHGLDETPFVLYVGRMMPQKGARAVLDAAQVVWQRVPEARFVFIGPASPSEAAMFEGADGRILYLGKVSVQEKADALAACDVFCMPSLSEILPTVYLEAWSYGKPVVGGKAHGLPELVEGNGAGLTAAQDPEELGGILAHLLQDEDERTRLGEQGRQLVDQKYSVPAVTAALESLYTRLAAGSADRP
jgi:phosphatidyl-myo-inositol dimannoside synthase